MLLFLRSSAFATTTVTTAFAALLAAGSTAALADPTGPLPSQAVAAAAVPMATTGTLKLVNAVFNYAPSASVALVAGFNNIDTATSIKCANAAGCTIVSNATAQVNPPAGVLWAVCTQLDGVYMNPGCPYQGHLPDAGTYVTGSAQFSGTVAKGTHLLQTQVYVSSPSVLGSYHVQYSVYKP